MNEAHVDLDRPITGDADVRILTLKDEEGLVVLRHSCAHVLAQAVLRLYPQALPAIGPVIENGFMYDFDNLGITDDDLKRIEEEMRKIVREKHPTKRHEYKTAAAAKKDYKDNPYKLEIIDEYKTGLSTYVQGEFRDLCRGPHCPHTGWPSVFKLYKVAKAYWRGDSKNKQLTRIYGYCFAKRKELEEHLMMVEEARKRDHRRLGKRLGLFMFHEYSPGSPFFLPKGTIVYEQLMRLIRDEYRKRGYEEVITPLVYDKELWQRSGHWQHYKENMFLTEVEGRTFSMKPMNCPSHCLIYQQQARSYRDLPVRIADFAPLHRNELSGTLSGLTRVRKFSQDDAHIFCTEEQIPEEVKACMEFVKYIYSEVFAMEYHVELSTRPEKFMGDIAVWNRAEAALADVLEDLEVPFTVNEGDGAFYGPKIDIHVKDAIGRSHQLATVQLDMQMPERFQLSYEDSGGGRRRTVMIHRAILGSLERFIGMLIEHYEGRFPLWLSPEQVRILPIADRHVAASAVYLKRLLDKGIRATLDDRKLTTNKKVREAEVDKVNYVLVIGDREVEAKTANVRTRENVILGERSPDEFIALLLEEIEKRRPCTSRV